MSSSGDDSGSDEDGGDEVHRLLPSIIDGLNSDSNPSAKAASLMVLTDALAFTQYEEDLVDLPLDEIVPLLVNLVEKSESAEIMLKSARILTYFLDLMPNSANVLAKHGAVKALCGPLVRIQCIDVAEQCLEALEKLSKKDPVACLKGGVIVAALGFMDFFGISIQRVALSTVNNVCKDIPADCFSVVIDAVPILCNILDNEDQKLVESAAMCLMRIGENCSHSSELMDELCKHGVVEHSIKLISPDGRMAFSKRTYTGMIGLLGRLVTRSLVTVKALCELNIGSLLGSILRSSDISGYTPHSLCNDMSSDQMYVALKLINQIIPPVASDDQDIQLVLSKEHIILNQPKFLLQFATEVVPVFVQVVNSGANTCICFGCVSVVRNYVSFATLDMLQELVNCVNMSSFLMGLLSRKDHHVLIPALSIVEILMKKLSVALLDSFSKEGVIHAIQSLCGPHSLKLDEKSSHGQNVDNEPVAHDLSRCLCYVFDQCLHPSSSELKPCRLQSHIVPTLAQCIMSTFFSESWISGIGLSTSLCKLKAWCRAIDTIVDDPLNSAEKEDYLLKILTKVLMELSRGESLSTFEFTESGVARSLARFLSNRNYTSDIYLTVLRRLQKFSSMSLSGQSWEDFPLTSLVHYLQNALSTLDCSPVVVSSSYEPNLRRPDIPVGCSSTHLYLQVLFTKEEGEMDLSDNSNVLIIEISTQYDAIEEFLRPRIYKKAAVGKKMLCHKKQSLKAESNKEKKKTKTDHFKSSSSQSNEVGVELKLDFLLKGKQLDQSTTLYQAILQEKTNANSDFVVDATFWNEIHRVTYRRTRMQRPSSFKMCTDSSQSSLDADILSWQKFSLFNTMLLAELPSELENSSTSNYTLILLKILEGINRFSFQLCSYERSNAFSEGKLENFDDLKATIIPIPQSQFISTKLTYKLEQQMHDRLAICSASMPSWCSQLAVASPFLFSFEARWKYFCLSAFAYSGNRTQNFQKEDMNTTSEARSLSTALPRKRFKVHRHNILGSAAKMMSWYAGIKAVIEIEFNGEVGFGLGPTLEFYTLVSRELQKASLYMWRGDQRSLYASQRQETRKVVSGSDFVIGTCGLFPRPWPGDTDFSNGINFSKVLKNFLLLGQLIARAIRDRRILDLPLSRAFYKLILEQDLDIYDIQSFDPELGKILVEFQALVNRKIYLEFKSGRHADDTVDISYRNIRIEDLCLDFTLPGYPEYVLTSTNNSKVVNISNLEEYVSGVVDATTRSGISRQMESFKAGFNKVFPIKSLQIFSPEELERVLCGEQETWNLNQLQDHINFDHGYTSSSPPVLKFLEIIQEFDYKKRRAFLMFVTGAPRLPPGGLASLKPKLTLVCKLCSNDADKELPSVMTCVNYLKLPPYSSKEIMREKLLYAIMEGQGAFHLS